MRKTLGIFALSLLLLSCGNKGQQQEEPSPNLTEKVRKLNDSSSDVVNEEPAVDQNKIEVVPRQPMGSSTHPSSHHTDNMCGFDPASEDDMDDNGMSRYMENDDEEGWE